MSLFSYLNVWLFSFSYERILFKWKRATLATCFSFFLWYIKVLSFNGVIYIDFSHGVNMGITCIESCDTEPFCPPLFPAIRYGAPTVFPAIQSGYGVPTMYRHSAGGDWEQQGPSCHSRGPETDIPHPHHNNYCDGEQMTGGGRSLLGVWRLSLPVGEAWGSWASGRGAGEAGCLRGSGVSEGGRRAGWQGGTRAG